MLSHTVGICLALGFGASTTGCNEPLESGDDVYADSDDDANGAGLGALRQTPVNPELLALSPKPSALQAAIVGEGSISYDKWNNVEGITVGDIPVLTTPDEVGEYTIFEAPTNQGTNYGQRVRGYLTAPLSGDYFFWIASDDQSELWLSSDEDPANKALIATVDGYTVSRQWNKYASQKSAAVPLLAGNRYYIEALHKEGTGGDHLAVAWSRPGEGTSTPSEVIPGEQLSPWSTGESMAKFYHYTFSAPATDDSPSAPGTGSLLFDVASAVSPEDGSSGVFTSPTLDVVVTGYEDGPMDVDFLGREKGEDPWTLIVLPDTQKHTLNASSPSSIFLDQAEWIVENKEALNIQMVVHEGDGVEDWNSTAQRAYADEALTAIIDADIPSLVVPGNNDYNNNFVTRLSIGNDDYLFLGLGFCPSPDEIDWANDVLGRYPDHKAILTTHAYITDHGGLYSPITPCHGGTEYIFNDLVDLNDNIVMVLSGHMHNADGEFHRTVTRTSGAPVHELVADYQDRPNIRFGG